MNFTLEKSETQMIHELEQENARLAAENEQLRREREILKRTLGIMSEPMEEEVQSRPRKVGGR